MSLSPRIGWTALALSTLIVAGGAVAAPGPKPAAHANTPPAVEAADVPRAIEVKSLPTLDQILPRIQRARVVFVGETHDRLDHHQNQLEVIQRLHARRPSIAIGMEFFQQPFQGVLDDYVAGRISERELLARSEYFDRWRFDYRLYRPILQYAREHGIPLVALNVPAELTSKVGREGIEGLTEAERAQLPAEINRDDEAYHARLRKVFDLHPQSGHQAFERWLDVQLLWDEGMAERAARYLQENPRRTLVVLAGSGHLAFRSGIPNRVARRTGAQGVVLLPVDGAALESGVADFLLTSREQSLPPAGRLGVGIEVRDGRVLVSSLEPTGGAKEAGVREGDQIVAVDGNPVERFADVRLALWERAVGEQATVEVLRSRWFGAEERLTLPVTLR
ncbi:MAG: ChaN family lipoprotein [Gammaproteobacteria bacterium]|nr:ChaN family lipoprotein [Gammaproteobacteria bacterium]